MNTIKGLIAVIAVTFIAAAPALDHAHAATHSNAASAAVSHAVITSDDTPWG